MNANKVRRYRWHWIVFGSLLVGGCSSEQSEFVYEDVILQLPSTLDVTTVVEDNSCSGTLGNAQGLDSTVVIEQVNNSFVWTQNGNGEDGIPLQFFGKVCDSQGLELRMRAESLVRIPQDNGFCRTTLQAPEMAGECGDILDLCEDPAALSLKWDECRGSFHGRFNVLLSYTEACVTVQDCRVEMTLSARLPSIESVSCEDEVELGEPECNRSIPCVCPADG